MEEASNAMALDGVKFRDAYLKVGARVLSCCACDCVFYFCRFGVAVCFLFVCFVIL